MNPVQGEITCSPHSLREFRLARGLAIGELAHMAGLTPGCISRIEAGQRVARPATTRALARALRIAVYRLHPDADALEASRPGRRREVRPRKRSAA